LAAKGMAGPAWLRSLPIASARAVEQVLRMAYGQDYDRSQLIPKVTRLMNDNDDGLSHEQDENKLKFCKRWGEALTEKSLIQRKFRDRRDRAGDVKESHLLAFAVARRAPHR